MKLEDTQIRASALIEPFVERGRVTMLDARREPARKPQVRPSRRSIVFGKKCCGTGYGQPHVDGCRGRLP